MSKRILFLVLALAATLLVLTCARQQQGGRGVGSAQWRQEAYNRYVIIDFKLRRVFYMANREKARVFAYYNAEAMKQQVGQAGQSFDVTRSAMMVVNKDSTAAFTTAASNTCDSLLAVIAAIEAEIVKLETDVANLEAQTAASKDGAIDGVIAFARVVGMSKDLSEIEDEIKSVKEGGGGAWPGLELPTSCPDAFAKLEELQAKLSALAARVEALKAKFGL